MRDLTLNEVNYIAGGIDSNNMSGMDRYFANYAEYAGMSAGLITGPFLALGTAVAAAVYYCIYTPLYYIAYGVAIAAQYTANSIYNAGSYVVNKVSG